MAACGPSRGFCNVRSGSRNGLDSLAQLIVFQREGLKKLAGFSQPKSGQSSHPKAATQRLSQYSFRGNVVLPGNTPWPATRPEAWTQRTRSLRWCRSEEAMPSRMLQGRQKRFHSTRIGRLRAVDLSMAGDCQPCKSTTGHAGKKKIHLCGNSSLRELVLGG